MALLADATSFVWFTGSNWRLKRAMLHVTGLVSAVEQLPCHARPGAVPVGVAWAALRRWRREIDCRHSRIVRGMCSITEGAASLLRRPAT
jgi:hypothetical protein